MQRSFKTSPGQCNAYSTIFFLSLKGPLETDMVKEIRANIGKLDPSLHEPYSKPQLDPVDSARKIFDLLERDEFPSGAHIDYYDLPDNSATSQLG